jgi:hypothetical protein
MTPAIAPLAPMVGKTRCNAAQQIKNKVPKRTQTIFDVIAKDVKRPHIAQKMPEPAVKKHEREPRQKLLTGGKIRCNLWH